MKRYLVFGMTENPGGIENFILNYYKKLDRKQIQFDFLCNTPNTIAYEEELGLLGGQVYRIPSRKSNWWMFFHDLLHVLSQKKWDGIWVNMNNLANIDYLILAKHKGIKRRIVHSHNSYDSNGLFRRVLHEINKRIICIYATDFWACSKEAADWFYTRRLQKEVQIIPNAIEINKFKYNAEKRNTIRNAYEWESCFVIGCVGRLSAQKNHSFLIDLFARFYTLYPFSKLVIVGQGEEEDALKEKVNILGVSEAVFFVGAQKDIQAWLSSFDLFCFPSLYEGFSVAALEAQANGVPILASSSAMQKEVTINNNVRVLSLTNAPDIWLQEMESMMDMSREKHDIIAEAFSGRHLNIEIESKKLQELLEQ